MVEAINRDDARFIKELLDRAAYKSIICLASNTSKGEECFGDFYLKRLGYKSTNERAETSYTWVRFMLNTHIFTQIMTKICIICCSDAIGDEEMTAWLLDHGAGPNRRCLIDFTPLSLAVESTPISIISLMFSRGGDAGKGQLLHHTIERRSGTIEVLKLLLEKGAPLDSTAYEDHPSWALFHFMGLGTALHKAAELGKVDVVNFLISEGANQCVKDANGRTPIDCARMLNQWHVIEVLDKGKWFVF
jgi:ankyrin repeat protein